MFSSAHNQINKRSIVSTCTAPNQSQSMFYKDKSVPSVHRRVFTVGAAGLVIILLCIIFFFDEDLVSGNPVAPVGNKYKGTPWSNERTVSVKTIGETKFARCDVHTVKSEDGKSQINDWLFLEEMDAVNVAVVTSEGKFVVFEQMKYAIPGKTLSPVGGFVDAGEAPWEGARREVMEELGLGSRKTEQQMTTIIGGGVVDRSARISAFAAIPKVTRSLDEFNLANGDVSGDEDWVYLGKYRTAANRGGGFIYTYLLKNALPILPDGGIDRFRMTGDDEIQIIKLLSLTEVKEKIRNGAFQEIKWAATFALSLLHLVE